MNRLDAPKGLPGPEVNWALGQCLGRCTRPGCRQRGELRFHALAASGRKPEAGRFVILCDACRRRARRDEFTIHTMQVWKSHMMEYWDNVGAE